MYRFCTLAIGVISDGPPTKVIRDVLPCAPGSGDVLGSCTIGHLHGHLRGRLTGLDGQLAELQAHRGALATILAATEPKGPYKPPPGPHQPDRAAGPYSVTAAGSYGLTVPPARTRWLAAAWVSGRRTGRRSPWRSRA
ncbi:hypothetical protein [Nonomuraea sp. NPDC050643]|uniref:hypothetical protein n=1 Tax=Nonomuraea sp. NPDC050643 TaxID=3155660 RepID=UPI0033EEF2A1